MMSMFFQAVGKPSGATVTSIFGENNGQKVVKSRFFLAIMGGAFAIELSGWSRSKATLLGPKSNFVWILS